MKRNIRLYKIILKNIERNENTLLIKTKKKYLNETKSKNLKQILQ